MNLPVDEIAHLLFSTRQAKPESGSGFNREIVAESPGLPERARSGLADLADMTGFVLRKPALPPLWAFRRLDADAWLLVRAVSLGLYRKGNHQLLAHGLLLRRHHLEWLGGNPFLLASPEAGEAGFHFEVEHPGGRSELAPKRLGPSFAGTAARLNLERFDHLSQEMDRVADSSDAFPTLFAGLLDRDRCLAWSPPPGMDPEQPDRRFLEWLLLHLHPADRAELALHSWYAYDSPREFDLVGVASSDADELRRHLKGEVSLWPGDGGDEAASEAASLGHLVQRLRRQDPRHYWQVVDETYLTLLQPRFKSDLRERTLEVVPPAEASLALLHALKEDLDDDELGIVKKLHQRQENSLLHETGRMAKAWESHPERFASRLSLHRELPLSTSESDWRASLQRRHTPEELWALLGLLPSTEPAAPPPELRQAWSRLMPGESLAKMLGEIADPRRAGLVEEILDPWMLALVPEDDSDDAGALPPWFDYLRFLHHWRRPVLSAAAAYERRLHDAPDPVKLAGYRELQRVGFEIGMEPFALRLLFQQEIPRLGEAAKRIRTADGLARLLPLSLDVDEILGPAVADPVVAEAAYRKLAEVFVADSAADHPRLAACAGAVARGAGALPDAAVRAAAATLVDGAGSGGMIADGIDTLAANRGGLTARLLAAAARSIAERLRQQQDSAPLLQSAPSLQSAPLLQSAALLVDLRNELPEDGADGEDGREVDRALVELMLLALILAPPQAGAGLSLRRHFHAWLQRMLDGGRFPALIDRPRAWRHLLLDELISVPPPDGQRASDDPRRRAYHLLAWQLWARATDSADPQGEGGDRARRAAEMGLLRGLAQLGPAAHRRVLENTIPPSHEDAARLVLSRWFPDVSPSPGHRTGPGPGPNLESS